ncbi:hypothetical protein V6N12_014001 [Hibiscus sabdariffa]|uniref:Uncharacterized protein n=1 Tax=Hibiscus sabdariffa TaxID=183260 RepID=A0ABR1ZL23_9ROSI
MNKSTSSLPGEVQEQDDEVDTNNDASGIVCAICFEDVSLPELALLGSCEHVSTAFFNGRPAVEFLPFAHNANVNFNPSTYIVVLTAGN